MTKNCPNRCWWCGDAVDYQVYHDEQWGVPVTDDQALFEKVCLEAFQCGLSWITILRRREALREAFHQFEITRVAQMKPGAVEHLLENSKIIRHRGKIESVISNANATLQVQGIYGSLANLLWSFEPTCHGSPARREDVASTSAESIQMSRQLKKLGFRFVGPTTCYSLMQATGMVNDHLITCDWHDRVEQLRANMKRPTASSC